MCLERKRSERTEDSTIKNQESIRGEEYSQDGKEDRCRGNEQNDKTKQKIARQKEHTTKQTQLANENIINEIIKS